MQSASDRHGARHSAEVPARIGLLGNPSDGYGGRVIAGTVAELSCRVSGVATSTWDFGHGDGAVLVRAAVEHAFETGATPECRPLALTFETTIPRQAGLSGSSAIIIGTLRVLADAAGVRWDLVDLARTALRVEVDHLGWTAGPQDRVIQSFGGLMDMDFAAAWNRAGYEHLDPNALPPLVLVWSDPGESSDHVHADVRQRWVAGDPAVRAAMGRFAELAGAGRRALDDAAPERWIELMNDAFELRCRFWDVSPADHAAVAVLHRQGGGATLAGSGGAVVGAMPDAHGVTAALEACGAAGMHAIAPTIGPVLP